MKKENYIWLAIVALVLIIGISLMVSKSGKNVEETELIPEPISNVDVNASTSTPEEVEEQITFIVNPDSPLAKGKFVVEMMTEAEKEKMGIDKETKAQVLQRTKDGSISLHRLIMSDADMVKTQTELDALIAPTE